MRKEMNCDLVPAIEVVQCSSFQALFESEKACLEAVLAVLGSFEEENWEVSDFIFDGKFFRVAYEEENHLIFFFVPVVPVEEEYTPEDYAFDFLPNYDDSEIEEVFDKFLDD